MKFVTVRQLRSQSAQLWRDLSEQKDLVLTRSGKPIGLLSSISEESLLDSLKAMRTARAAAALEQMWKASKLAGTDKMTLKEINKVIDAVRRERRK